MHIIYIPLCFYFITQPRRWGRRELKIYIPLCFYFIPCGFFFHFSVLFSFTFHYASTLSCQSVRIMSRPRNLHSTMLLLYQIGTVQTLEPGQHLHSTMLLLYPTAGHAVKVADRKFTFHYASTLSKDALNGQVEGLDIYIPLCFYFIRTHYFYP